MKLPITYVKAAGFGLLLFFIALGAWIYRQDLHRLAAQVFLPAWLALMPSALNPQGCEYLEGVTEDDAIQCGYFALLDAVKAYDPAQGLKFTAYLKYPVMNQWNVLIGYRTQKQKREPLSIAASLDEPIKDGEGNETERVDTVECTAATQAFQAAEDDLYTQQLHDDLERILSKLDPTQEKIVRERHFTKNHKGDSKRIGIDRKAGARLGVQRLEESCTEYPLAKATQGVDYQHPRSARHWADKLEV